MHIVIIPPRHIRSVAALGQPSQNLLGSMFVVPNSFGSLVFYGLVMWASRLMRAEGAFLWGINVGVNPLSFPVDHVSRKLGLVIGPLYGIMNRHDPSLHATRDALEDTERTILFWIRDGVVLRFRSLAMGDEGGEGGLKAAVPKRTTS